ncbi:MAG: HEPN domain-containing protein [Planctomycetes bacterium]|nr:HEPN domain-containing protein [Planctomycetota bacterium]
MREIRSLLDRAKRYLCSAEVLLADGDNESAASRTYYAIVNHRRMNE